MAWFALVAGLVVACSKESPPPPESKPIPIVSAAPSVPGTEPSGVLWASASGSLSASAVASTSSAPKTFACGGSGMPKCPLQNWMNNNIKPAMASKDPERVAGKLREIAKMAPADGYPDWASIANDGAAAVDAKKDVNAAKPSCTKCHDLYKKKWKAEDRDRAI